MTQPYRPVGPADQKSQNSPEIMSELDNIEQLQHFDRHGLFARAAAWPARRDASRTAHRPPVDTPRNRTWLCLLPPELLPIGHLAAALTRQSTTPPSTTGRVWIYPAVVRQGAQPAPLLAAVPPATLYGLGTAPTDEAVAHAIANAPQHSIAHVADAKRHLTDILFDLIHLFEHASSTDSSGAFADPLVQADETLDAALAALDLQTPISDNPAKQIAQRLHERLPVFWGTSLPAHVAALWAMRRQWTAEGAAFAMTTGDLARLGVLARLPRYWPNAACFVQLGSTLSDAKLTASVTHILSRRRFPTQAVISPSSLTERAALIYLIELGEWVALYAAYLSQADPTARTAHSILFES